MIRQRTRRRAMAIVCLAVTLACCTSNRLDRLPEPAFQPTRLAAPFDVAARRAVIGSAAAAFVCASAPEPPREAAALAAASETVLRGVAEMADRYVRTEPVDPAPARCALEWLDSWALAEALVAGERPSRGEFLERTLSGISLAYLKFRDEPTLPRERKELVEAWLAAVAHATLSRSMPRRAGEIADERAGWPALAATAAGIASGDRGLFEWGMARCRVALSRPDDYQARSLTGELAALTPMVLTLELGAANGVDLYAESGSAIHKRVGLARLRVEAAMDIEPIGTRHGQTAEIMDGALLGWGEAYAARFGESRLGRILARHRPLSSPWLGGDLTLVFAPPEAMRR